MRAWQVEGINMLDGVSTEEEPVIAQEAISILSVHSKSNITNVWRITSLSVSKLGVFEASATGICKTRIWGA